MTEHKPADPADKAADGAFGGIHSHRAGYGDDKLARLIDWVRQRPSATLASGEGALLLAEIDRLRARCRQIDDEAYDYAEQIEQLKAAAKDSADHYADARAEIDRLRDDLHTQDGWVQWAKGEMDGLRVAFKIERSNTLRLERILAALREPSEGVVEAALNEYDRRYSHGPLSMRLTRHEPYHRASLTESLSAAVAAAEQEVEHE